MSMMLDTPLTEGEEAWQRELHEHLGKNRTHGKAGCLVCRLLATVTAERTRREAAEEALKDALRSTPAAPDDGLRHRFSPLGCKHAHGRVRDNHDCTYCPDCGRWQDDIVREHGYPDEDDDRPTDAALRTGEGVTE